MKSRGIIMSGTSVLAMIEGRKTCTRRLDKSWLKHKAGDEIWMKERFGLIWIPSGYALTKGSSLPPKEDLKDYIPIYEATMSDFEESLNPKFWNAMFMFREHSRITRILTEDARLERLQDITEEEARREGIANAAYAINPIRSFREYLWDPLHKPGQRWADNPEDVRLCWGNYD